jgi:hypothetical protein
MAALGGSFVLAWLVALAIVLPATASGTEYFHLSGYVRDEGTRSAIGGAIVEVGVPQAEGYKQTVSFDDGYYNMTLPAGSQPVSVNASGYKTYSGTVNITANMSLDFDLAKSSTASGCSGTGIVMAIPLGTLCLMALLRKRGPA